MPPGTTTVAGGPTGYLAFASPPDGSGAPDDAYRSVDGRAWEPVPSLPTGTGGVAAALVQADGTAVVAADVANASGTVDVLRLDATGGWSQVTWPTAPDSAALVRALEIGPDEVVAVGSIGERRPAAWLGQSRPRTPRRVPSATRRQPAVPRGRRGP